MKRNRTKHLELVRGDTVGMVASNLRERLRRRQPAAQTPGGGAGRSVNLHQQIYNHVLFYRLLVCSI